MKKMTMQEAAVELDRIFKTGDPRPNVDHVLFDGWDAGFLLIYHTPESYRAGVYEVAETYYGGKLNA
ncbi:MAG: hypothetical protein Tp138OMZ00d2C19078221_63 [Prokaryotic dsDNA virus sp.]|jgi:hypothetical protein|nr:hypothetical protein [Pseudomonadales bacterium]QDP67491.1 MAG: hypothetical protein Tp138OMZ00d2C19078221_63 [Prokaryotic dsDNA virus sp.]|tara:strand:- start:27830 stop:28030 length:201 start_codon:yes stop_codon:yes gene_type:complete